MRNTRPWKMVTVTLYTWWNARDAVTPLRHQTADNAANRDPVDRGRKY